MHAAGTVNRISSALPMPKSPRETATVIRPLLLSVTAIALSGCSVSAPAFAGADKGEKKEALTRSTWHGWRGPEGTGVSRETGLPDRAKLEKGGENFVFAVPHSGLSSPVVMNGKVFVVGRCGDKATQQEVVQAFDAKTGALAWEDKLNVWHSDIVDARLGFTNVAADPETGYVFAHVTSGELIAYHAATGKVAWKRSLTEEFGRVSGYGGRVTSPMVDEDKVIVGMPNASWGEQTIGNIRLVALDKKTGQVIWWAHGDHAVKNTYHSTPVAAVIGGRRLILTGGGDGCVHAFLARTGKRVWSLQIADNHEAVNVTPVVQGDRIWIGHGEENEGNTQGRVVCIDGADVKDMKPKEVWRVDGIKAKFASPVLHEGLLYIPDEAGKLYCLEADTGKELWNYDYGTATKGSPVWADGKIYIAEVDSEFHILKPSREECKAVSSIKFRGMGGVKVELHGSPAICDGRIYFTTTTQLVCIGKADGGEVKVKIPEPVREPDRKGEADHIQVVPADVTLSPGESAELKAYAYDANGRRLGEAEVEWSLAGMRPPVFPIGFKAPPPANGATPPPPLGGKLSAEKGKSVSFTAAKMPAGQFGRVVARAGKLSGEARVRVAPVLPFEMDFEKVPEGRTPGGWVNTMGKFAVAKAPGGGLALKKRNDTSNPLIAQANAYISVPGLKEYTIEADVYSNKVRESMADMGVGACRYSLVLMGNEQVLRLNTWDALYGGRVTTEMKFDYKPETWYRMKLTASVAGGKGVIKGKVWPRGEKEPDKWTIELTDPIPNTEGAPLLYGFANGTIDAKSPGPDSYFDNVKITRN
jgi:outer membrane protein assembly factor BamB